MQTCQRLRGLVDTTAQLQLAIELFIDGLLPLELPTQSAVAAPPPTASENVALLRRRRTAWESLEPNNVLSLDLKSEVYVTYEVAGAIFAQGKPRTNDTEPTSSIDFWEIPRAHGGDAATRHFRHDDFGFDAVDFTFDPTQDLLVLAEIHESVAAIADLRKLRIVS